MLTLGYLLAVGLRQTIHVVVIALDAEVLCQVYYLHVGWYGVLLEECLALAVTETEEYHVNLVKRHLAGKLQFGVAYQTFVHVIHLVACIRFRIGKHYLHLRVVHQQTYELTTRVACSAKYADLNDPLLASLAGVPPREGG